MYPKVLWVVGFLLLGSLGQFTEAQLGTAVLESSVEGVMGEAPVMRSCELQTGGNRIEPIVFPFNLHLILMPEPHEIPQSS